MAAVSSFLYFLLSLSFQSPIVRHPIGVQRNVSRNEIFQHDMIHHCPPNEILSECINPCNSCDQHGICLDYIYPCDQGCDCIKGYLRDDTGKCIAEKECKDDSNNFSQEKPSEDLITPEDKDENFQDDMIQHCPPNEIPSECINPCNSCDQRGICLGHVYSCQHGCDCIRGYFRDDIGKCIAEKECKALTTKTIRRNLCPTNWNECNELCRKQGRRGGYCAGAWSERCSCIMRSRSESGPSINSNLAYSVWMRMMNNQGG